jgi:hypothetical protein
MSVRAAVRPSGHRDIDFLGLLQQIRFTASLSRIARLALTPSAQQLPRD